MAAAAATAAFVASSSSEEEGGGGVLSFVGQEGGDVSDVAFREGKGGGGR